MKKAPPNFPCMSHELGSNTVIHHLEKTPPSACIRHGTGHFFSAHCTYINNWNVEGRGVSFNTRPVRWRFDVTFGYGFGAGFRYGLDRDDWLGPATVAIHYFDELAIDAEEENWWFVMMLWLTGMGGALVMYCNLNKGKLHVL